jgi:hypothetical protein
MAKRFFRSVNEIAKEWKEECFDWKEGGRDAACTKLTNNDPTQYDHWSPFNSHTNPPLPLPVFNI